MSAGTEFMLKKTDKTKVYTDENGNVMYDESIEEHKHSKSHRFWKHFPFWLIAIIGFLVWGIQRSIARLGTQLGMLSDNSSLLHTC